MDSGKAQGQEAPDIVVASVGGEQPGGGDTLLSEEELKEVATQAVLAVEPGAIPAEGAQAGADPGGPGILSQAKDAMSSAAGSVGDAIASGGGTFKGALGTVGEKLGPGVDSVKESGAAIVSAIRRHPMGALLTGVGLYLLFSGDGEGSSPGRLAGLGIGEKVSDLGGRVTDVMSQTKGRISEVSGQASHRIWSRLEDHPMAAGAIAGLLGVAVAMLIPSTSAESKLLGESSSNLIESAKSSVKEGLGETVAGAIQEQLK